MRGLIITSMLALGLSLLATQGSARTLVAIDPATAAALDDSKALVDALTMISDDAATLSDQASAAGDDYAASVLSNLAESTSATASDVERSIVISIEHGISMTKVAIYVSRLSADFDLVASDASDVSSVTDLLSGELQAAADLHDALSADVGDGRGRPGRPTRAGRNGTTAQASTSGMPSGSGASNASANGMGLSTNLQ